MKYYNLAVCISRLKGEIATKYEIKAIVSAMKQDRAKIKAKKIAKKSSPEK